MITLKSATESFVARYHADPRLCADQARWDCTLSLRATDTSQQVRLEIRDGRVAALAGGDGPCTLAVSAPLRTLLDILQLRLNPNQPYLFGELTVHGQEADFMRVDYIATMLCAA
jgi:putative sterol carrier protein